MRKLICLAIVLLVFKTVSFAQEAWQLGGEITPQRSVLYNWNDWNADPWVLDPMYRNELHINSVSFGFFASRHFNEYLSLETRLLYSAQRQDYDMKNVPEKPSAKGFREFYTKTNYLKLPVLLNLHTSTEANTFFSLSIGPQFSYLLNYYQTFSQEAEKDDPYYFYHGYIMKDKSKYIKAESANPLDQLSIDTTYSLTKRSYSSVNLGLTAYLSGNFYLSDNLILQIALRADYELTDAENKDAEVFGERKNYKVWPRDIKGSPYPSNVDRKATHNITWGLSIGLSVLLE
jgi:outer membrane protein with beta-barrel domain